jgi:hypothetical protein
MKKILHSIRVQLTLAICEVAEAINPGENPCTMTHLLWLAQGRTALWDIENQVTFFATSNPNIRAELAEIFEAEERAAIRQGKKILEASWDGEV